MLRRDQVRSAFGVFTRKRQKPGLAEARLLGIRSLADLPDNLQISRSRFRTDSSTSCTAYCTDLHHDTLFAKR